MKRTLGMGAAALLVLLQLGAVAACSAEPQLDFSPIDGPELVASQRA